MVNIEPFKFQKANNIDEHNQLANKLNECVEVFNEADLESIPDLIGKVEDINVDLGNVESDVNSLKTTVSQHTNDIAKLDGDVDSLQTQMTDANESIETLNTNLGAETIARKNANITAIAMGRNGGEITTTLNRALGNLVATVDCPFISTATLIPTTTERAFKIQFTFTDGSQYDTNEFVIPEGGGSGTDVTVSAVTVGAGTAENSFKVTIQLSDGSTIASNDYVINIPESVNTYPTAIAGTVQGTGESMTLDITLNNDTHVNGTVDLGLLATVNELAEYETQEDAEAKFATKASIADMETKTNASATYATKTELVTKADASTVSAIGITSSGNTLTVNGKTATAVNSVTGSVSDNKLKITINGVSSGDIPLPNATLGVFIPTQIIAGVTCRTSSTYGWCSEYTPYSEPNTPIITTWGPLWSDGDVVTGKFTPISYENLANSHSTLPISTIESLIPTEIVNTLDDGDYWIKLGYILADGTVIKDIWTPSYSDNKVEVSVLNHMVAVVDDAVYIRIPTKSTSVEVVGVFMDLILGSR